MFPTYGRAAALLSSLGFMAALVQCVGDTPVVQDSGVDAAPDSGVDAAPDVTLPDSSTDADAAASKCVFPEAGAPGTLDLTFQAQFYPGLTHGQGAAFDSAGAIYVGGWDQGTTCNPPQGSAYAYFAKMTNSGALDTNFGSGGHLCVHPTTLSTEFNALAADPDGTVLAAGFSSDLSTSAANTHALVARVTSAGQLVSSFGASGTLSFDAFSGDRTVADAVALDTSVSPAKIVVAGSNIYYFAATPSKAWVMRFGHDGSPDLTFNGGQPVVDTTSFGFYGVTVVNGSIFVTGGAGNPSQPTAIVRKLTPAGAWDSSFGGGNAVPVPLGANNSGMGEGVVALGTGVAIAGPKTAGVAYGDPAAVAAISATGAVSSGFGTGGSVDTAYAGQPLLFETLYQFGAISSDCEGRLLVSTALHSDAGASYEVAVTRLLTTGAMDTTFGASGIALASGFNAHAATNPVEDPKTGGVLVLIRDPTTANLGLIRFNR